MKNVKFFSGLLIGIVVGVCIMALIKCKSASSVQEQQVQNSFTELNVLNVWPTGGVYKLTVDNIQYLVVSKPNAVAIIKHK